MPLAVIPKRKSSLLHLRQHRASHHHDDIPPVPTISLEDIALDIPPVPPLRLKIPKVQVPAPLPSPPNSVIDCDSDSDFDSSSPFKSPTWCEKPHSTIAEIFRCDLVHSLGDESVTDRINRRQYHSELLLARDTIYSPSEEEVEKERMERMKLTIGERRCGPKWKIEVVKVVSNYTVTRRNRDDATIYCRKTRC